MKNTEKTSTHNKILRSLIHSLVIFNTERSRMQRTLRCRRFYGMRFQYEGSCRASFCPYGSDDCGRVAVCSKREISFYKWTDGFGMLLCAQKIRRQKGKGKK